MLDIDAAALRHQRENPPPAWWPVPPPTVGPIHRFHPVIGPPTGGNWGIDFASPDPDIAGIIDHVPPAALEPEPEPDAEPTNGDILDVVYPGDSIPAIAARLGRKRGWLDRRRARDAGLAMDMDRRRGRRSFYSREAA